MSQPTYTQQAVLRSSPKRMLEAGLLRGDCLTVTGRTLAEEAAQAKETPGQQVVRVKNNPLKPTGGLVILKGNLAPEGCVIKVAGHNYAEFSRSCACV